MKILRQLACLTLVLTLLAAPWLRAGDEPRTEEPKKEEPRKEEPRKEEPKKDKPKKEEPRKEEPRKEEPRKEEPRKEEPKKETPKKPLNPKDPGYYEELLRRRAESKRDSQTEEEARRKKAEQERRKKEEEAQEKAEKANKERQEEYRRKEEAARKARQEEEQRKKGEDNSRRETPRKEEPRKEEPRKEEPRKEEPRKEEPRRDGEGPGTAGDDIKRPLLPSPAYGFAGMIRGTVISRDGNRVLVKVDAVEGWPHSRASDARSLIGREVSIEVDKSVFKTPQQAEGPLRFLETLQPGQSELFDVSNRAGNVLCFLELTKGQRERLENNPR